MPKTNTAAKPQGAPKAARPKAAPNRPAKKSVKVVRGFYDLAERADRKAGDTFEATEARYKEIADKLPGYVELA